MILSQTLNRNKIFCVDDLRNRARKRLPRFVFDFIEGAAGDESAAQRNLDAFSAITITPRLRNRGAISATTTIFGTTYAAPFGIAPLGLAELILPKADLILANAAAIANIPYICSAAAGATLRDIIRFTGRVPWFQLYCPREEAVADAIISEAQHSGVEVLVVTIDVPVPGKRLRDLRNGLQVPLRLRPTIVADSIMSPQWSARRLWRGRVRFPNFERHVPKGSLPIHEMMALQTGGILDWEWFSRLRDRWPGKLVIKGILCEHDAAHAATIGIDGLIVSNHGGRQFEGAPASITCLPRVKIMAGTSTVMLDSGIRKGSDILRAIRLGADFAWIGRPFLYALAAFGAEGPTELIRLFAEEIESALALTGYNSCAHLRGRPNAPVERPAEPSLPLSSD